NRGSDGFIREDTKTMRARNDAERAVRTLGSVEMNSQGNDTRERRSRSMSVEDTLFHRPRTPALRLESRLEGKGGVLMPHHEPVRTLCLFEQRGPVRKWRPTQKSFCEIGK